MPIHSFQHDTASCNAETTARPEGADLSEPAQGLLAASAAVSPKYLYDTLGSKLFETLCLLPEYYPTRTEAAIFQKQLPLIAQAIGTGATLVDLGAGNCAKAEKLFGALAPCCYVPVDISAEFLRQAVEPLGRRHPGIKMVPVAQDFSAGLRLPAGLPAGRSVFFYPGSSIGNFAPDDAARFLRGLRTACPGDCALLLGVDLVKDAGVLEAAYDDALGVTAAFNLNLLRNLNRLLDADFNVRDWRHVAFFNARLSRIEMHLEARKAVTASWDGASRRFAQGERIHTESSYKYTRQSLGQLLRRSGFRVADFWTDEREWFAVVHARPDDQPAIREDDAP